MLLVTSPLFTLFPCIFFWPITLHLQTQFFNKTNNQMKKSSHWMLFMLISWVLGGCIKAEEVINPDTTENDCLLSAINRNGDKSEDFAYDASGNLTKHQRYDASGEVYLFTNYEKAGNVVTLRAFKRTQGNTQEFRKNQVKEFVLNEEGYPISEKTIIYDDNETPFFDVKSSFQYNKDGYFIEMTREITLLQVSISTDNPENRKLFITKTYSYQDDNTLASAYRKRTNNYDNKVVENNYKYEFYAQDNSKPFPINYNMLVDEFNHYPFGKRQSKLLKQATGVYTIDGVKYQTSISDYSFQLDEQGYLAKMKQSFTDEEGKTTTQNYDYVKNCVE
ncbi:hypothetical protein BKI52_41600 [marine bacterium AO1-C]|nr:hypothetical protein BKI52_41600 [marine bacterium AO1-C]